MPTRQTGEDAAERMLLTIPVPHIEASSRRLDAVCPRDVRDLKGGRMSATTSPAAVRRHARRAQLGAAAHTAQQRSLSLPVAVPHRVRDLRRLPAALRAELEPVSARSWSAARPSSARQLRARRSGPQLLGRRPQRAVVRHDPDSRHAGPRACSSRSSSTARSSAGRRSFVSATSCPSQCPAWSRR